MLKFQTDCIRFRNFRDFRGICN